MTSIIETEMSVAFKRAAILRDTPPRSAKLIGPKDGKQRIVHVLHETQDKNGVEYSKVSMAFNAVEDAAIRPKGFRVVRMRDPVSKVDVTRFIVYSNAHELWVRSDRLGYIS